jgi:transcriptional antiterminator NusG
MSLEEENVDLPADEPMDETPAESGVPTAEPTEPAASANQAEPEETTPADEYSWYVLKVQSNRENSIRDAIVRRIKIAGIEDRVAEVVVPTEKVTEMKGGKKRVMERKFYPGYIMCRMIMDDETWLTMRETPGVGDFVGAGGKPVAMTPDDVARMLGRKEKAAEEKQPRLQINFVKGDRVKIKEGAFENFEGSVDEVIESKGLVRVIVNVFNRPTPVELEYWQVEPV